MSEKNRKFSSQETEDRRGRRTGFGNRSERNQSGNATDRRDDERAPKQRKERSYFDSKGNYKGRPIDDGDGNGRRNSYNDLPSRSSSKRDNPRRDDKRDERRGSRDFTPRGDSDRKPQRGGYQGRPVERAERNENPRREFGGRPERSDSRRHERRYRDGDSDNRGRVDSRERGEPRERTERSGSRPQRGGYQGRPVERDETKRREFSGRSEHSGSHRKDSKFQGEDRRREYSDRRDSRRSFDNDDRRSSGVKRGFDRNDRSGRPQREKRDGNEAFSRRPKRHNSNEERAPRENRSDSRGKQMRSPRPQKKTVLPAKPSIPNLDEPLRINKALAFAGVCSRRAADDLIAQGVVFVNGEKIEEPGVKIIPNTDVLEVNAERVSFTTEKVEPLYLLLNKPVQTVCTANDPEGRPTVLDIIPEKFKGKRIFPVGRLDFFSTGLLILTNDGELTHRLTHPKWHQNKVYRVRVRGEVSEQDLEKFRKGMTLEEGEKLAPVECKILAHDEGNTRVEMVLTQGINRQIRRMFRDIGLTILNLHRVKIGPIQIGELGKGESRELTQEELALLYEATGLTQK
ncbi:pseudouridine synthase [Halodesulfovibrio spirochaetisodalis]|uniref:pseudouridine synthase n=1 Tax=Halodesulfovibrio spirochaetisodalis TaxID=1560234 RepID=UPI000B33B501|nr:pseudouridine synthase [Halodesulfovibrio spirochaetisodalis]